MSLNRVFVFLLLFTQPSLAIENIAIKAEKNSQKTTKIGETLGKTILKILEENLDKNNTTTMRKEIKSVVHRDSLEAYLKHLQHPFKKKYWYRKNKEFHIDLVDRDKQHSNYQNSTFTFYGKGVRFGNLGANTKIKLRARFYLRHYNDDKIIRSPYHNQFAFLELKIRNPAPDKIDSVNKYRIHIRDSDLIKLYQLEPNDSDFERKLSKIKENTKKSITFDTILDNGEIETVSVKNKRKLVTTIFDVISQLVKVEPDIIRPAMGTSYIRISKRKLIPQHDNIRGWYIIYRIKWSPSTFHCML